MRDFVTSCIDYLKSTSYWIRQIFKKLLTRYKKFIFVNITGNLIRKVIKSGETVKLMV